MTTLRAGIDSSDARRGAAEFNSATRSMVDGARNTQRHLERMKFALLAFGSAAAFASVRFVKSSVDSASAAEETRAKFEAVFKDQSAQAEAWAARTAAAYGRTETQIQAFMSSLQDTFVPFGFARDAAAELSQGVTQLAIDLGAFYNTAESDNIARLTSALVGNHEAVRSMGVVITEATLQQELLALGYTKGARNASEQQKALARLSLILASTADAQGAAAREADGYAAATRRLDSSWQRFTETLGREFLPAATAVSNWLSGTFDFISRNLGPAIEAISKSFDGFAGIDLRDQNRAPLQLIDLSQWQEQRALVKQSSDEYLAFRERIKATFAGLDDSGAAGAKAASAEADRSEKLREAMREEIALLTLKNELIAAQMRGDETVASALRNQIELRAAISDEMRAADPALAAQIERETLLTAELERQKAAREAQERQFQQMSSVISGGIRDFASGAKSWQDALQGVIVRLAEMVVQLLIIKPLMDAIRASMGGGGLPFFADGAAFATNVRPVPFASGGVVHSPTRFTAGGMHGLMGEAGPEAIMPLKRGTDGKLGVASDGRGGNVFNFNVAGDMTDETAERVAAMVQTAIRASAPGIVEAATVNVQRRHRSDRSFLNR